jgi:hypothetical protein
MKNKAKPETCMALGYMYDEALGFCMNYFALYPHTRRHIWDANEEEANVGEVLVGSGKLKRLSTIEMECIHEHVITNAMATKALYRYYVNHYACIYIEAKSCFLPNGPNGSHGPIKSPI